MLTEIKKVRQVEGEGLRRWFTDQDLDLILWYDLSNKLEGFQFSIDKRSVMRTLTCRISQDPAGNFKTTISSDGPLNRERTARLFREASGAMEEKLRHFVQDRLDAYGGSS